MADVPQEVQDHQEDPQLAEEAPFVVGALGQGEEEQQGVGEAGLHQDPIAQHDHPCENCERLRQQLAVKKKVSFCY